MPFLDLSYQTQQVRQGFLEHLSSILDDNAFINGKLVQDFERLFSRTLFSEHENLSIIGVANGTDALDIALQSLKLQPGQEVIVTPFTFAAPIEAIVRSGARPVFCDIDPDTLLLDPDNRTIPIQDAFSSLTRGILLVHLFGKTVPPEPFLTLKSEAKFPLWILEDAAQAHGSAYVDPWSGQRTLAASYGQMATFSFHPTKNLGAFGDAGAIVTQDPVLSKSARMIANHGMTRKYYHEILGQNSRLDSVQAAVLLAKLSFFKTWQQQRREIAKAYRFHLAEHPQVGLLDPNAGDVYHHFVVRIYKGASTREALQKYLRQRDVGTQVYYPYALHELPAFKDACRVHGDLFHSIEATKQVLALPCYPGLSLDQVLYVCEGIKQFFLNHG